MNNLREFPSLKVITQSDKNKLNVLVNAMLELHKHLVSTKGEREKESLQRLIDETDLNIDTLVNEIYGLTEDEIEIVNGN